MANITKTTITVESKIYNPNRNILEEFGVIQQSMARSLFNFLNNNEKIDKDTINFLQREYIKKFNIQARIFNKNL